MIDRNYILNLIKSKDVTIDQFNYNKLTAPPIYYYFNDIDLNRLYQIATSLRYVAKPQAKYQEIDNIMKSRGFRKLSAGTNRIVYSCIENDTFVAKVAYDTVAINDNPREFINQEYLKPFCAKTFEVSRNGVLSFQERVNPITNREEFLSVARDIFELITEFIIGEYVMDDIGTNYFMNYGIRRGISPVLLDYTFLYKLDGNKLFCNKPDPSTETGLCGGEIDYDFGYNNLICKKCGKIYRAHELELNISKKMIITRDNSKGEHKMKVTISGGTRKYSVTTEINSINVNEVKDQVVWTEDKKEENKSNNTIEKQKEIHVSLKDLSNNQTNTSTIIRTSNNKKSEDNIVEKTVNGVQEPPIVVTETKEEEKQVTTNLPAVEEVQPEKKDYKKPLKSPISEGDVVKKTPVEILRDSIYQAAKNISDATLSNNATEEYVKGAISNIKYLIDTIRSTNVWNINNERELLNIVIDNEHQILDLKNEKDETQVIATATIYGVKDGVRESINEISAIYTPEDSTPEDIEEFAEYDEEEAAKAIDVDDEYYLPDEEEESNNEEYEDNLEDDAEPALVGVATFVGKIIDIASKFPNSQSKPVLVIEDSTGEYLTVGENGDHLLVVDRINGIDTSEAEIVSKSFVNNVLQEVQDKATDLPTEDLPTVNGVS